MFALITTSGLYYNGKAGSAWVCANKAEAFGMGEGEAARKRDLFNSRTVLHGLTFNVVAL